MSEPERKYTGFARLAEITRAKAEAARALVPVAHTPVETTPAVESTAPVTSTPVETTAPVNYTPQPLQFTPAVESTAPVDSTPLKRGYLRLPNTLIDDILPTLRPAEQAVLLRLFRLSHGFNKTTCTVSMKTLASTCFLSESQTRFAVRNVEQRGYVRAISTDIKNPNQQLRGIVYEVLPDINAPVKTTAGVETTAPVKTTPNKGSNKKTDIKGGDSLCAKCKGTGWFYPEGVAKGVKKCEH